MRKFNLLKWGFLCLFCMLTTFGWADTETTATITWDWNSNHASLSSASDITAEISASEGISASITLGESLSWASSFKNWSSDEGWADYYFAEVSGPSETYIRTSNDDEYTIVHPSEVTSIDFKLTIEEGYTFTPTGVSFIAERDGTNGGHFSVYWVPDYDAETVDTTNVVAQSILGSREGSSYDASPSTSTYDITADATSSVCGLRIMVVNLDKDKKIGFANVVITGTLTSPDGTTTEPFDVTAEPNHSSEDEAIEEFSAITVTIDGTDVAIDDDILQTVSFTGINGTGSITVTASDPDTETENGKTIYTLTLSETISGTDGRIIYILPEGLFTMGGAVSNECDGVVYIKTPEVSEDTYKWVFDPEDNSIITGSLDKITITFNVDNETYPDAEVYFDAGYNSAVRVYKDDTDITDEVGIDIEADDDWTNFGNVGYIYFKTAITKPGTYTIEIDGTNGDNGAAFWGEIDGDEITFEDAITLTYTIEAADITCDLVTKAIATDDEGENYYITLNFDPAVKIDETNTSISVEGVEGSSIPYTAGNADNTEYAEEWTLTIDGTNLSSYMGSNLSLTVAAVTEDGASDSFDFTVSTADPETWTFDPVEGSTFGTSDGGGYLKVTITCIDGIEINSDNTESITISGVNSSDEEINLAGYNVSVTAGNDGTSYTIALTSALTSDYWGTYTYTIPASYFLVGTSKTPNEATTLTYYVGATTGINGITLQAGSDGKFYNLNGQRVSAPTHGIYILNGKKVLIK